MIIAFSPEQAHEVSEAFDLPWFMSESLYPTNINKEDTSEESSYPTYIHKENNAKKKSKTTNEDSKPAAKDINEDSKPAAKESHEKAKKDCRRNARCSSDNMAFHPCHTFLRAARCAQQAAMKKEKVGTKTIAQRNPIHFHDETPQLAKMSLDVSGFTSEDITINVEDFVVTIKGKRTNRLGDVFSLDRKFRLDKKTAILDEVTASFEDGILELTVPKKMTAGPRKIPISVSSSASTASISKEDDDESKSHEVADAVATTSVEEVEQPQSSEGTSSDKISDDVNENSSIEAETVDEEEPESEEVDGEEIASDDDSPDVVTKKSTEEEAWEEVLE